MEDITEELNTKEVLKIAKVNQIFLVGKVSIDYLGRNFALIHFCSFFLAQTNYLY